MPIAFFKEGRKKRGGRKNTSLELNRYSSRDISRITIMGAARCIKHHPERHRLKSRRRHLKGVGDVNLYFI
jgi:hypothetical protein